jgi:hypothetical protein
MLTIQGTASRCLYRKPLLHSGDSTVNQTLAMKHVASCSRSTHSLVSRLKRRPASVRLVSDGVLLSSAIRTPQTTMYTDLGSRRFSSIPSCRPFGANMPMPRRQRKRRPVACGDTGTWQSSGCLQSTYWYDGFKDPAYLDRGISIRSHRLNCRSSPQ